MSSDIDGFVHLKYNSLFTNYCSVRNNYTVQIVVFYRVFKVGTAKKPTGFYLVYTRISQPCWLSSYFVTVLTWTIQVYDI